MSQRKPGYGAKIKDTLTGAQKRRPATALKAYRDNFPFPESSREERRLARAIISGVVGAAMIRERSA